MFVFPFDPLDFSFPWPVKWPRLFHWAAFDFDFLSASKAIVECRDVTPMLGLKLATLDGMLIAKSWAAGVAENPLLQPLKS